MTNEELKPMDIGKLIDKTFKIFFSTMKKNLKITLIFIGISTGIMLISGLIIGLVIYYNYGSINETNNYEKIIPQILFLLPFFILFFIASITSLVFFYGMINDVYLNAFMENEWSFKKSFDLVKKNFWSIFLSGFLYVIIFSFINCCCLFFPLAVFLSLSIPSMLYENKMADGISRSFKLVSYSFWNVLGAKLLFGLIMIAFLFVAIVIVMIICGIIAAILFAIGKFNDKFDSNTMIIIFYLIFLIIYSPFAFFINTIECAFNVLIFFNQKIKHENFGVEILTESIVNAGVTDK